MEKSVLKINKCLSLALSYLTDEVRLAITDKLSKMRTSEMSISEIRLRLDGVSALVVSGENIALGIRIGHAEMREIFRRVSGGALFAHVEDVRRGFITLPHGIRVGVSGYARYENGGVVGIADISSLAFRIPSGRCSFAPELYKEWLMLGGGMLICSSAGEGKTTAIRALASLIGSGKHPRRVVVVDERCEFDTDEYRDAHVDILRGYRRALGVDIGIRTMSAEVLIVDEISSSEDSRAMLASVGAGVTVIATAHASSLAGAISRPYLRELIDGGLFEGIAFIKRRGELFSYSLERIEKTDLSLHGMGDICCI